jgi:hypothetical protein
MTHENGVVNAQNELAVARDAARVARAASTGHRSRV